MSRLALCGLPTEVQLMILEHVLNARNPIKIRGVRNFNTITHLGWKPPALFGVSRHYRHLAQGLYFRVNKVSVMPDNAIEVFRFISIFNSSIERYSWRIDIDYHLDVTERAPVFSVADVFVALPHGFIFQRRPELLRIRVVPFFNYVPCHIRLSIQAIIDGYVMDVLNDKANPRWLTGRIEELLFKEGPERTLLEDTWSAEHGVDLRSLPPPLAGINGFLGQVFGFPLAHRRSRVKMLEQYYGEY